MRLRRLHIATMAGHSDEIYGLTRNSEGTKLASGCNDNRVKEWDNRHRSSSPTPIHRLNHLKAAIKALTWATWSSNLLATGSGTGDGRIMFWNTNTGKHVRSRHTRSTVCSIFVVSRGQGARDCPGARQEYDQLVEALQNVRNRRIVGAQFQCYAHGVESGWTDRDICCQRWDCTIMEDFREQGFTWLRPTFRTS